MIFSHRNLEKCKWSKCDKGVYRGYHTPIEWTQHEQYVKIDLPPPIYPVQFRYDDSMHYPNTTTDRDGNVENLYYTHNTVQRNSSRKWQYVAVGTTVAVWIIIAWSVMKIL